MIPKLISYSETKQYLVFDFDLTIAKMDIDWKDWHPGIAKVFDQFDPSHGYAAGKGISPHHFYNQMVGKYGPSLVSKVQKFNSDYETAHLKGFLPYQELIDLIPKLNNNQLIIYSSNSRESVNKGLKEFKIDSYFKQIITRDDTQYLKPNPEGFNLIKGFQENKQSFLMVGDSSSDEEAAKAAGIDFLKCDYFGTYKF